MKNTGLADSPFFVKKKAAEKTQPRHNDTMVSRNREIMISKISGAIQEIGKEASTYRLSRTEKKALTKIIYQFNLRNVRITENKIIRTGLNYILYNFNSQRKKSLLNFMVTNN